MKVASTRMETKTQRCMVPNDPQWPERMKTRAMTYLKKYDSCTQSILWAFMQELGMENRMVLRAGGAMQGRHDEFADLWCAHGRADDSRVDGGKGKA